MKHDDSMETLDTRHFVTDELVCGWPTTARAATSDTSVLAEATLATPWLVARDPRRCVHRDVRPSPCCLRLRLFQCHEGLLKEYLVELFTKVHARRRGGSFN